MVSLIPDIFAERIGGEGNTQGTEPEKAAGGGSGFTQRRIAVDIGIGKVVRKQAHTVPFVAGE